VDIGNNYKNFGTGDRAMNIKEKNDNAEFGKFGPFLDIKKKPIMTYLAKKMEIT
jgi:hypothetical protein